MSREYLKKAVPGHKKNWWTFGFLVFMVIGMSSGFVFFGFNDGSKVVYNGHKFIYKGDHWEVKINGIIAATSYAPEQVMGVEVPSELPTLLQNKVQIDTTSDMNDSMKDWISLAQYQMGMTLASGSVYLRAGFLQNDTGFPKISCESASSFVPVLYFKSSNDTSASIEGNCIVVEARSGQEMILLKDRILYAMLGLDKQK